MKKYIPCSRADIPANVRFDTPRRNMGQIVEVSYGGFGAAEHDDGDPYMRVTDRSAGTTEFFALYDGPAPVDPSALDSDVEAAESRASEADSALRAYQAAIYAGGRTCTADEQREEGRLMRVGQAARFALGRAKQERAANEKLRSLIV